MIKFEKFTLGNGLKVIVHNDPTTTIVAFNILYNVGARDENPQKTGFAHLFEHLMFEGSTNIHSFHKPLQLAGGESNAFTSNDITNYYITIAKENIETAFWLESDRMLGLDFSEEKLSVQKNVVIEEFNQRYLNQPYGDIHLLLRPLVYKKHPYSWPTIGKETSHIENANLTEVKSFFDTYYAPNNAILSIVGNVSTKQIKDLAEKWFGQIKPVKNILRNFPLEPKQTEARTLTVERDVPFDAIYKAFRMCDRLHNDYYTFDLISDLLANGKSSRLYQNLVIQQKLFSEINAYISGSIHDGMFVISGKLIKGVTINDAEKAINQELSKIAYDDISEKEIEKVKNKFESVYLYGHINALNKAKDLAYYELVGDANFINSEVEKYRNVSLDDIRRVAQNAFNQNNSSTVYYLAK